jgi:quercetin dioxygenase-like cupin family protein
MRKARALRSSVAAALLAACASAPPEELPRERQDPEVVERLLHGGPPALRPYLDAYPLGVSGTRVDHLASTASHSMHFVQTTKPIAPHVHPARTETIYVLRGTGTCRIGDRSYPVSPGAAFKVAPGRPHGVVPDAGSTLIAIVYFEPPLGDADDRVPVQ